jgi:hypothetical protein
VQIWQSGSYAWNPNLPASATKFSGGAGGGSGGGSGTASGGGSGSGAGIIHIYAAKILGSGTVGAVGGKGAAGTAINCGGGGGGGGGCIVICSTTPQAQTSIVLDVSGGPAGLSGGGTGVNGTVGSPGRTYWIDDTSWVYGNAADGNTTLGNTTLSRDVYYNNLTVNAGAVITTAGYRIFVKGILNLNGTGVIRRNGISATGTSGAGPLTASMTAASGAGGSGGVTNGVAGTGGTSSLGATGGKGGNGSGGTGPNGTAVVAPGSTAGGTGIPRSFPFAQIPTLHGNSFSRYNGGGGGSGGAGNGTTAGGGGGSGGGSAHVYARFVAPGGGIIEADGGSGATSLTAGCGGGGGGGGGLVVFVTSQPLNTLGLTITAKGGLGGLGGGSGGVNGGEGQTGRIYLLRSE